MSQNLYGRFQDPFVLCGVGQNANLAGFLISAHLSGHQSLTVLVPLFILSSTVAFGWVVLLSFVKVSLGADKAYWRLGFSFFCSALKTQYRGGYRRLVMANEAINASTVNRS